MTCKPDPAVKRHLGIILPPDMKTAGVEEGEIFCGHRDKVTDRILLGIGLIN
ncbi:MAG: hypothetical protein Q7U64_03955 [Desulfocapsaceae bacterium]|nr:hypothetical protein [Desulfocapsaceae bacterium]